MDTVIWFENLETGQRWAVSHPDLIQKLLQDPKFKEIEDPTVEKTPKPRAVKQTKAKAGDASAE